MPGDPKYIAASNAVGEIIKTGIIGASILLPLSFGQLEPLLKAHSPCLFEPLRWEITALFFSLGSGVWNVTRLPATLLVADITKDRFTHFLLALQYASILMALLFLAVGFLIAYPILR